MEAIRKIIDPSTHKVVIELREHYQNRILTVVVLAIEEEKSSLQNLISRIYIASLTGKEMPWRNKES